MRIQQVRNATLVIEYGGSRFLIDPMLAEQGAYPGLPGTVNSHLPYPTAALPVPVASLLDVDAVIVTHTHPDHWDEAARTLVPKHLPVFVQHEADRALLASQGFGDVRLLRDAIFQGVTLRQTTGQHGSDAAIGAIGDILGEVCGVVFEHAGEDTLYLAGDTVWNAQVEDNLRRYNPQVVILNAGDARVIGLGAIIMDAQDVWQAYQAAPGATLIASHMEAVNHAVLTRRALREFAIEKSMTDRLRIPEDGEAYRL